MKSHIVKLDAALVLKNWDKIVTGTKDAPAWNKRKKAAKDKVDAAMLAEMQKIQDAALKKFINSGKIGWARKRVGGNLKWALTEKDTGTEILSLNGKAIVDGLAGVNVAFPLVQAQAHIFDLEGKIEHLYKDTSNNVTIGIGHMLANVDKALELHENGTPFLAREKIIRRLPKDLDEIDSFQVNNPSNSLGERQYLIFEKDEKVDRTQVRADFESVEVITGGKDKKASFYKDLSKTKLSNSSMLSLFAKELPSFLKVARQRFPLMSSYPPEVQIVLLDFAFNLKRKSFSRGVFGKFFAAIDNRDWKRMSKESSRKGENGEKLGDRNDATVLILKGAIKREPYFYKKGMSRQLRVIGDLK